MRRRCPALCMQNKHIRMQSHLCTFSCVVHNINYHNYAFTTHIDMVILSSIHPQIVSPHSRNIGLFSYECWACLFVCVCVCACVHWYACYQRLARNSISGRRLRCPVRSLFSMLNHWQRRRRRWRERRQSWLCKKCVAIVAVIGCDSEHVRRATGDALHTRTRSPRERIH